MDSQIRCQQTLQQQISYSGIGLHTGQEVQITCQPLPANSGIIFKRVDLPDKPEVKAVVDNIKSTKRSTSLGLEDRFKINTTEHILAALRGLKIDNLLIEIDASEVPIADGSAKLFVELLQEAGIKKQQAQQKIYHFKEAIWVKEGDTYLTILPDSEFKVSYTFVSDHPAVGDQFGEFIINEETFVNQLAPSRTFGFASEIKSLQQQGLALGGNLDNAILIGEDEIVNDLRFEKEIVRHKILDIVGDLALVQPFRGHVLAVRSGHALNRKLARRIQKVISEEINLGKGDELC
ncbi:MAG: UDP-3-O-acyl-N-acetylglucosamine deacetylase [Bacillota bacterium]